MSRWYRAYEGIVTDAKLGEVALVAGCSRSVAIAAWHCILESAASVNDGGRFDTTPRRVAVILSEPLPTIEAVFGEMGALGMIGDATVSAWARRQFQSDTSTERSRKHREAKRNSDATLQGRSATPPETDTENRYTTLLNGRVRELYEAAGVTDETKTPGLLVLSEPINWINSGCDLDADVLPAIRAKAARRPITNWAYCSAAVFEARDRRLAPAPAVQVRAASPPKPRYGRQSAQDALRELENDSRYQGEGDSGNARLLPAIGR